MSTPDLHGRLSDSSFWCQTRLRGKAGSTNRHGLVAMTLKLVMKIDMIVVSEPIPSPDRMRFGDFQTSNRSRSLKDGISVDGAEKRGREPVS